MWHVKRRSTSLGNLVRPVSLRQWLLAMVLLRILDCSRSLLVADETTAGAARLHPGITSVAHLKEAEPAGNVAARIFDDVAQSISISLLLIARDEEVNLKANLPLWRDVISSYVIGVDDRTTDGTVQAIQDSLPRDKPRFVFFYTFEDFAQARNTVLRSSSHHFPQATHVLIADADWRPELETVDISELDLQHGIFHFRIWDHSGHTARLAGWLLKNDPGLSFTYRVHEVLDTSTVTSGGSKLIPWEVSVVESNSSWHAGEHGHSRTAERFLFDMNLLELDYKDNPRDLHTLFYLGITTYSYLETLVGKGTHKRTPDLDKLVHDGMVYFREAIDLFGEQKESEFVWSSIRWLAYGYHYFVGDAFEAEGWYNKCIAYDPARVDCKVFLSRLYLDNGQLDKAWETAKVALLHRDTKNRPLDYFYIFECFVPIQAAAVIARRVTEAALGSDSLAGVLTLGSYLIRHHRHQCAHGVLVDTPETLDELELWFQNAVQQEDVNLTETKRLVLLQPQASLLSVLLETWGTGSSATQTIRLKRDIHVAGDPKVTERLPHASSDIASGNAYGGLHQETGLRRLADRSCEDIVLWAKSQMDVDGRSKLMRRPPPFAALTPTHLEQMKATIPGVDAAMSREFRNPFRALLFGGGAPDGGQNAGGAEIEDDGLLEVVSLLMQLASLSIRRELTYAHDDNRALETLRKVVDRCPDELGTRNGTLRLVRSTIQSFVDSDAGETFDFIDIDGPTSKTRSKGVDTGDEMSANSRTQETLRHFGAKLAKGGCMRFWAFAANPSTDMLFRAASRRNRSIRNDRTDEEVQRLAESQDAMSSESWLGNALRQAFAARSHDGAVDREEQRTYATDEDLRGVRGAAAAELNGQQDTSAVQEAWARKILAGGDTWNLADLDEMVTSADLSLVHLLGRDVQQDHVRPDDGSRLADLSGLVGDNLSSWEIMDYIDSLQASPILVHQALAVRRATGVSSAASA